GRFASARLGHTATITTRRVDEQEVTLRIDWGDFADGDAYLDEVPVSLSTTTPSVFVDGGIAAQTFSELLREFQSAPATAVGTAHGTVVRLERLRTAWGTNEIEALKRSLSRLLPPPPPAERSVADQPEFSIYIDTPEGPPRHHSGFVSATETRARPRYRRGGAADADGDASLALCAGDEEPVEVVQATLREGAKRA